MIPAALALVALTATETPPPVPHDLVVWRGSVVETAGRFPTAAACDQARTRIDGDARAVTLDGVTFFLVARAFCLEVPQ